MCADIFISYAREDRTTAQLLADVFDEQGWDVWWDREIQGGTAFATEIERALQSSRAAVVLWSPSAVASDFVRDEARRAMRAGKLLPIRIAEVEPPLGFGETHTLDLLHWDGDRQSGDLIELLNQLRQRLDGAARQPLPSPPVAARRRSSAWIGGAGGVLAMLAVVVALLSHRKSGSTDCVPPGESKTWEELNEGRDQFNAGDMEKARATFNKVLAAEPGFARARYYLAQVLIRSNENDVAYDMLKGLREQVTGRNDCAVDPGELKKIDKFMADLTPDPVEADGAIARAEPPDAPIPDLARPSASIAAPEPVPVPTAVMPSATPKPRQRVPLGVEAERRLQAEVDAAFGPNSDHRLEATTALIAAPDALSDAVPLLLEKLQGMVAGPANPDAEQYACIANALNLLQSATPASLNANRDGFNMLLRQLRRYAGNPAEAEAAKLVAKLQEAEGQQPVAYLQLASDTQRPFADALAAKLRTAGYEVPAYETVGNRAPPDVTEIRIQGRSDRELARWMTQALGKLGAPQVRARSLRKVQPDNDVFEIWLDQGLCAPEGTQVAACKGG